MRIPPFYTPRAYQAPLFNCLSQGFKRGVAVWHRRAGKDLTALNLILKEGYKRLGAYYYFFPTYTQGRKIVWDGFDGAGRRFLEYFPPGYRKNDQEMKLTMPSGSIMQIVGTDKFDRIVGPNPVGCVFSEYALQDPRAWDLVRPILKENKGWALFLYTPRGKNHGWDILQRAKRSSRWFWSHLTVENTKRPDGHRVITNKDLDEEREDGMSEDMIQQEYFCSFDLGIEGAYYARLLTKAERSGRIGTIPFDPVVVVNTAWDLGVDDSCVIWFWQKVQGEIHLIDYYENSGEGIMHYAHILDNKRQELGYRYGDHYAPHDVEAREKFSGRSLKDQAKDIGLEFITVPRDVNINSGIEAVRGLIPRSWFDVGRCTPGIDALQNYRKEYNHKLKAYSNRPLHDWSSHGADGFRTLANAIRLGKVERGMTAEEARRLREQYGPPSAMSA